MSRNGLHGCVALIALGLAGCEGAGRFSDLRGRQSVEPPAPRQQTFTPAPMGRVETSSLPPPGGYDPQRSEPLPPGSGERLGSPGLPPAGSSVPIGEPPRPPLRQPDPVISEPANAPPQMASRPPQAVPAPSAPSRTSVTGNWTARESSGGNCRVTLSSTPALDLYKASTAGCQSRELQRISAWELRGDEVYLYEPGGGIAARLKQSGRNFEGAAAKTGAPVSLSK